MNKNTEDNAQTAVAVRKRSVLAPMAARFNCEPSVLMNTLKQTVFKGATDAQFVTLCAVANQYGLNPLTKELYAFPDKKGGIVPVVSIDGWLHIMNQNPAFDGVEFEETSESCTAVIHRKDRAHPVKVTEWLDECRRDTEPWRRWPRRMLRHKALIQAIRVAFSLSGVVEQDEAERIVEAQEAEPEVREVTARAALPLAAPKGVSTETAEMVESPAPEEAEAQPAADDLEAVL